MGAIETTEYASNMLEDIKCVSIYLLVDDSHPLAIISDRFESEWLISRNLMTLHYQLCHM